MLSMRFRHTPHCRDREAAQAAVAIQEKLAPRTRLPLLDCFAALAMTVALAFAAGASFAADKEPPMELAWGKLMPPAPPVQTMKTKSFLSGATPWAGAGGSEPPPPPTIDDKRWMSEKRLQPGAGGTFQVVTELDGKRVRIGGYVVPLDFEATNVKEFLLVPFVGACIHVPPPPANQIIYVKTDKGFDVAGSFDPVWVTGTLKAASQYTGLAETGYSIDAEKVEARRE